MDFGKIITPLASITTDFEEGLIESILNTFEKIKLIGCLFHFKQALWRKTPGRTIYVKKRIFIEIIAKLALICWNNDDYRETLTDLKSENQQDQNNSNILDYYEFNSRIILLIKCFLMKI